MKISIVECYLYYDETFKYLEIFFFRNRISFDLNYSRLAGTLLTVITEMFNSEGDYVIQPPGKSIQYK